MNFIDFARSHGLEISSFVPSERVQRCGTIDKPRSKNGAFYFDGLRGWIWNWSGEARVQWFHDANAKPWTEAEKAAWKAKRQAAQCSQESSYARASIRGKEMLRDAKPEQHNYFHLKGFPDERGFVAADGALLIPMRNLRTNDLQGLQVVRWEEENRAYRKKMIPGMRAKGAVFRMGDKHAPETFLVEGYATGLSVHAALRSAGLRASVLVCFSANNIEFIAPQVKGRAFVCADNDKSGTGEKTATATGLPYCMSPVEGEDMNDLHARAGLMAVVAQLMAVRRLEQAMA